MKITQLADFLQGIEKKQDYPQGLQLDLASNQIGDEGAKALATALQSGRCPQGLRLDLSYNQIGDEGAKALATALQSGHCPQGLQLELGYNEIGDEGAKALATALQSGRCPQGLRLDLSYNQIGDEGAKALATALQSGRCPQGLQLNLYLNEIGDEGAKALATALQSGRCPKGLQLNLYLNEIGDESEKMLQEAWKVYYANQQSVAQVNNSNSINLERAITSYQTGEFDKALDELEQVLKNHPKHADTYGYRSMVYKAQGKLDQALADCNQALQLNPRCVLAYSNRAIIALINQQYPQAAEYMHYAAQIEANVPIVLLGKALLAQYGSQPDLKQAHKLLEEIRAYYAQPANKAKIAEPQSLLYYYAVTAEQLNDPITAKAMVEKVLSLGQYPVAEKRLADLKQAEQQKPQKKAVGDYYVWSTPAAAAQPAPAIPVAAPVRAVSSEGGSANSNSPAIKHLVDEVGQISLSLHIPHTELECQQKLGQGGFGIVYKGEHNYSPVAIKQLANQVVSEEVLAEFQREVSIMAKLRSPYVIQLYGACFDKGHYSMVMEYMPNGSLYEYLQKPQPIEWTVRYQIAVDSSCGMAYLHKQGIVHGDLKGLNILLDAHHHAKITDFGLSKLRLSSSVGTVFGASSGGSMRWMAPELFEEEAKNTKASDVYSFGMVLWEISARQIPFFKKAQRNEQVLALVLRGVKEDIPQDTPPSMAQLMKRCWDGRAEQRPTMDESVKVLRDEQAAKFKA